MSKYIRNISMNRNKNNTNGVFSISNEKVFYKQLNDLDYARELEGYDILKKYYDVVDQYASMDRNIILYEYDNNIHKNNGLLVDYFAVNNRLAIDYVNILKKYKDVFDKTIKYNKKGNCRMFFEERINTRFKNNTTNKLFIELDGKILDFNNNKVKIENRKIHQEIIKYFSSEKNTWNIISNADPNDMNIGLDGKLFDYTAGGYVPLMCEFAVFTCYNLIQAEYLSLKYNKKAFKEHKKIYKCINKVYVSKDRVKHIPRNIRIDAVLNYIDIVIAPIIKKINYDNWYDDFKNYLAMKILAVYDFNKMSKKDIILSITFLSIFYNEKITSLSELKILIKNIYGVKE